MSETENSPIIVGKCKKCDGDIIAKEKVFKCSNSNASYDEESKKWTENGCGYTILRQSLGKLGKPELTNEEVTKLLNDEVVEFNLVSKGGSQYSKPGSLAEANENGLAFVNIDFGKKE